MIETTIPYAEHRGDEKYVQRSSNGTKINIKEVSELDLSGSEYDTISGSR